MNSYTTFNHGLKSTAWRWIGLWLMLVSFAVQAADSPTVKTDPQIIRMQMQIDALNKRLQRLEKILLSHSPTQSMKPTPAPPHQLQPKLSALQELEKLRAKWKQLRRGLSISELQQLLGKPASKFELGRETVWYYKYPDIGVGSIMLRHDGKVSGWQYPPFRF